jgi:uncharacterized protein (TIGR02246 family)
MGYKSTTASAARALPRTTMAAATAIAIGIVGSAIAGMGCAQSGDLSQELDVQVSRYIASWNTHDAAVLASHFTPDADMIMGNGPMLDDRTAIQDSWRDYFAVQEPERKLTIEIRSTRAIAANVALMNVGTTTGGRASDGHELPPRKARGTWVLVRQDGEWQISAMRGMPTPQDRIIRSGG